MIPVINGKEYGYVKIGDGKDIAGVDSAAGGLVTIETEHDKIHDGEHYNISGFETESVDGTIQLVTTTSTSKVHMTFQVDSTAGINFQAYEGSFNISGGSAVTPINNDRNYTSASTLTVLKDPTIGDDGTLIFSTSVGSNRQSGFIQREREIVLKTETRYTWRITSLDNNNVVSYVGEWYEV